MFALASADDVAYGIADVEVERDESGEGEDGAGTGEKRE
jgi:hypothetical protein